MVFCVSNVTLSFNVSMKKALFSSTLYAHSTVTETPVRIDNSSLQVWALWYDDLSFTNTMSSKLWSQVTRNGAPCPNYSSGLYVSLLYLCVSVTVSFCCSILVLDYGNLSIFAVPIVPWYVRINVTCKFCVINTLNRSVSGAIFLTVSLCHVQYLASTGN